MVERNALCLHLPVIPRTLIREVVIPLGITVPFALNIYEGSFTSVSSLVTSPSSLVSPLWPLVSVYNSHSPEDCPTLYFLCPHIYLLKLYCVNLHVLVYCLGPLNLRIFPRASHVWLSPAASHAAQLPAMSSSACSVPSTDRACLLLPQ